MNKQNRTASLLAVISAMVLLAIGPARAGNLTVNGNLTVTSNQFFGAQTRQMITLYDGGVNANLGIGVQNSALYNRTGLGAGFAWFEGGQHSDSPGDPGLNGLTLMTLNNLGNLQVNAVGGVTAINGLNPIGTGVAGSSSLGYGLFGLSQYNTAVVGIGALSGVIGETANAAGYGVWGKNTNGDGVYGSSRYNGVHGVGDPGISGSTGVRGDGVHGVWGEGVAIGVYGKGYFGVFGVSIMGGEAGHFDGDVFVGGYLSLEANRTFIHGFDGTGNHWFSNGSAANPDADLIMDVHRNAPNNYDLFLNGALSTTVLTIRGGADVAEPFQMSSKEIPKGSVVVIDDENAGQLKLSDRAYDQRVAGIVSGANGINPGLTLQQQNVLEGGQNVALSGRVYVLADASSSPIKPGDLLTTSDTPGYAMKVTDHAQAQGAILGKAMSALPEGKGMVLVLVSLQ